MKPDIILPLAQVADAQSWSAATLIAVVGGVGLVVQEWLKKKAVEKTEQFFRVGLTKPVRVASNERRNSIILVGLGGSGKTSLIRALIEDAKANPEEKTQRYELYRGRVGNESEGIIYRYFVSDYKGQDLATLVGSFISQQQSFYSPMAYGYINSLIIMVDLVAPPEDRGTPTPMRSEPDMVRVGVHLKQWSDLALDAVKGLVTDESLKYVCLYVNKADRMRTRGADEDRQYKQVYAPLERALRDRFSNRVHVLLGSVDSGEGLVALREHLKNASVRE